MLIARHGSIVAGIGRVSALDHPGVRFATIADTPQCGGMSQYVFEPPLTQARVRWEGKPLTVARLGAAAIRGPRRITCVAAGDVRGRRVHEPPHRVVGEHPAIELLPHQIRGLAAEYPTALMQVSLELIKHALTLPALMVLRRQLQGGGVVFVKQCGQEPIPALGALGVG